MAFQKTFLWLLILSTAVQSGVLQVADTPLSTLTDPEQPIDLVDTHTTETPDNNLAATTDSNQFVGPVDSDIIGIPDDNLAPTTDPNQFVSHADTLATKTPDDNPSTDPNQSVGLLDTHTTEVNYLPATIDLTQSASPITTLPTKTSDDGPLAATTESKQSVGLIDTHTDETPHNDSLEATKAGALDEFSTFGLCSPNGHFKVSSNHTTESHLAEWYAKQIAAIDEKDLNEMGEVTAFVAFVLHQPGFSCIFDTGSCAPIPSCERYFKYARRNNPGADNDTILSEALKMHQATQIIRSSVAFTHTLYVSNGFMPAACFLLIADRLRGVNFRG